MTEGLSEERIISTVAEAAARRAARQTIAALQRMTVTLSGDDSCLRITWDEVCVQVQCERSFHWDAYDETVRALVMGCVKKMPKHEREAIWLQTDEGDDWHSEDPDRRTADPVFNDDIVDYITQVFVYREAGDWTNERIRAFLHY